MSEVQETGTRRKLKPNRFRITSIIIAMAMVVGALGILINPFGVNVSASITGDAYSGSGDWTVANPTVYNGETLTVYGNITISSTLTLTNTMLTIDQPSAMARKVSNSGGGALIIGGASWVGSTNQTDGKYNTELKISGGYIWATDCTFDGIWFNIGSSISYFVNAIFYGCGIWNNFGLGWETGEPVDTGPLYIGESQFLNTNTTGQAYKNLIVAGNDLTVDRCTFTNITLDSGIPSLCSYIRANVQNGLQIIDNVFSNTRFSTMFFYSYAPYTMTDNYVHGNHFLGFGGTLALKGWAINVFDGTGPVSNCQIDGNTFDIIRNGSEGIFVAENDWQITNNVFNYIDASGLTNSGSTRAIHIGPPGEVTVDGNRIDRMVGPGQDTGASCLGIMSQEAGGFTVTHNVIQNLSYLSCAIAIVDPIPFNTLSGILIHANTISNLRNASGGVAIFGGNGAVVSWNNISIVDGPSVGVMVDGNGKNATIHNNSVTGMFDTPNVWSWPDGWQIVVGAYTYYASGNIYDPSFIDNHASGGTMVHPDYNITGEKLGGGWWPNARMLVDTSDNAIIHYQNANVTLRHDGRVLSVMKDGVVQSMTHYANGTSWAFFNKTDLAHHFVNTTATDLTLSVSGSIGIIVSADPGTAEMAWSGTATAATVTFTLSGLESGRMYRLYIDGVSSSLLTASGSGVVSFTYSGPWSEHQFEIVATSIGGSISGLVNLVFIMFAIGIVVGVVAEGTNSLRKMQMRTSQQMIKSLVNMVVFIIIGIASLGVLYSMVI